LDGYTAYIKYCKKRKDIAGTSVHNTEKKKSIKEFSVERSGYSSPNSEIPELMAASLIIQQQKK
jgi:hypothetical protein